MKNYNIRFESENIYYVDVSEKLIPDYLEMVNNENIAKLLSGDVMNITYEDELNWVNKKLAKNAQIFSMIEKKSKKFIGNVELMHFEGDSAEMGISITEKFQGKGYGTEAIKAITNYGFENLNLNQINLIVFSHNARAIHTYKKLGFTTYKIQKNVKNIDNAPVDDIYMKLER